MCKWGTLVHTEIEGEKVGIDCCIFTLVRALNNYGVKTTASCCGHGNIPGNIILEDGRVLEIHPDSNIWTQTRKYDVNIHGEIIERDT